MSITGEELLFNLGVLLNDQNETIWDQDIKLDFINEGLAAVVLFRPDATSTTESVALTADTPKQSIPSDGVRFLDVMMNTDGDPVRKISRETMNESVPSWTTAAGSAIEHYMFDEENPKTFWVYPVPSSAISVELSYSKQPDEFDEDATELGIDETYLGAVKEYVLYRCLGMESTGQDLNKSVSHLNNFFSILGIKNQNDALLKQVQDQGV